MTAADRQARQPVPRFPGLTARERAVLAIRAWKADGYEPLGLRRHLPPDQDQEFHDLLSYFRSLGLTLAFVAPMWRQAIEKHAARYAWLLTLELTEIYVSALSSYILAHTRPPITESQHAERLAAGRAEMLPLGDLAELLADGNQDWAEKDMEDGDVSERAFARVQKEKKALLRSRGDARAAGHRRRRGD